MKKERLEQILDEVLFWASEVINDDKELYNTALNSWGLTPEECVELELIPETDDEEGDE